MELNYLVAFGAGLASFLAPCSLGLVPAWLAYVAGTSLSTDTASGVVRRRPSLLNLGLFGLGFTIIFVLLGASAGGISDAIRTYIPWFDRIGGALLIVLGLVSLQLIPVALFQGNRRWTPRGSMSSVGAIFIGFSFAAGWTPCVGPVLGAVLVLAGATASVLQGAALLFVYSLGLMLPFLAAGFATDWTAKLLRRSGHWLDWGTKVAGGLMIVMGILVFTGLLPEVLSLLPAPTVSIQ